MTGRRSSGKNFARGRSKNVAKQRKIAEMRKVLVSGGAGFIGSKLATELTLRGYRITILDNLSAQVHGEMATVSMSPEIVFLHGDVRSRDDCIRALAGQHALVHFAAETGTGQSMYQIERYTDVNMRGTANLLDVLANEPHSIEKIVVASSRAIYGEGKYLCHSHGIVYPGARSPSDLSTGDFTVKCPDCRAEATALATDESSRIHPSSVYGISKQVQEQLVMTVAGALGIPAVALRYQNVYGPGQSLRNPYTGILSIFSTRIRNGSPIFVFEDGKEGRDFIFIDDVVEATRLALESGAADFEALNVGSGVKIDVLTVANSLKSALGGQSSIAVSGKYRIGDIRDNFADIGKMRSHLGFTPRIGFAEGIQRFAEWVATQAVPADRFEKSIEEIERKGLYR
jgi:dTDP-L-rhamnose 4-epimerase